MRGYKEEGTTTTPFDMVMLNDLDRFHLVIDVIDRVPGLADRAGALRQEMEDARVAARAYTRAHGEDDPQHPRLELAGLTPAPMRVLVLNPGSSTLKAAVLVAESGEVVADDTIEWRAGLEGAADVVATSPRTATQSTPPMPSVIAWFTAARGTRPHPPSTTALLGAVEELDALAPLHNKRAASVMRAAKQLLPDLQHVACFDTAFHADLPEEAWRYPLPAEWVERWGIRRYGFHGLSVTWAVRTASELLERSREDLALVVAHLGSGCSVTAIDGGRSVDTSMGFTPYEGLMMGTRAGSVDPGILLRLAADGVPVEELADGLGHRCRVRRHRRHVRRA